MQVNNNKLANIASKLVQANCTKLALEVLDYESYMPSQRVTLPAPDPYIKVRLYEALKNLEDATDNLLDAQQREVNDIQLTDLREAIEQAAAQLTQLLQTTYDRAAQAKRTNMFKLTKIARQLLDKGFPAEARLLLADEVTKTPRDLLVEFFGSNPNPDDESFHKLAEDNELDVHELEAEAYKLAAEYVQFLRGGKAAAIGYTGDDLPDDVVKMGKEVESEHTDNEDQQKLIVLDHGAEYADENNKVNPEAVRMYYDEILKLEERIKAKFLGESKEAEGTESVVAIAARLLDKGEVKLTKEVRGKMNQQTLVKLAKKLIDKGEIKLARELLSDNARLGKGGDNLPQWKQKGISSNPDEALDDIIEVAVGELSLEPDKDNEGWKTLGIFIDDQEPDEEIVKAKLIEEIKSILPELVDDLLMQHTRGKSGW